MTVAARVAPIATGCALAAAAVTVALVDPSSPDSIYPPCLFHATTGLWCPGCGLTRATHHLLNGDVAASLSTNVFTPLVLLGLAGAWFTWLLRAWGRPVRPLGQRMSRPAGAVLLAAVVVFGVLRNIPLAPLDALAP